MSIRKTGITLLAAVFGGALLFGLGTTAHALSITYSDATGCGGSTCVGSVYSLDVQSGGGNLYNVTYTVNTSGYTGAGSGLDAIAFKITDNTSNVLNTSITSQPLTFSNPLLVGGLSAFLRRFHCVSSSGPPRCCGPDALRALHIDPSSVAAATRWVLRSPNGARTVCDPVSPFATGGTDLTIR